MEKFTLKAQPRDITRKKVRKLRNSGILPAAVFGFKGNHNVQLDNKEFGKVFAEAGSTAVVTLELDDRSHNVIIGEVQINPVTREYIHVSLREVNMNVSITANVPFELIGADESPAVKDEESLIILTRNEIEVKGLPKNIPQSITIDVSGFHSGDTVIMKDIKLPDGIELVREEESEETIVTTTSATIAEIVEETTPAEGEEGAETTEGAEAGEEKAEEEK